MHGNHRKGFSEGLVTTAELCSYWQDSWQKQNAVIDEYKDGCTCMTHMDVCVVHAQHLHGQYIWSSAKEQAIMFVETL